ncbi:MAG: flagellar motor switch protein FliM [Rhodospirillales bacterium]|nr:flagellar motor switch protein FliM [Rhodospirillales bacterium]
MTPADDDDPAAAGGSPAGGDDLDGWGEALAEAAKPAAPAPPPPPKAAAVLDQSEIDSLLGFADDAEEAQPVTGVRAILNRGPLSYERLPMLEVVFDRLVRLMSTSLRKFTSDNVEVSLEAISTVRFGDYLNRVPLPAMLSIFKAEQWENYGLITADSALIYSAVDILLGGRRGSAAIRIEGRPYTTIERSLVERMIDVMLADLTAAFEPLSPVTFRVDRLETNPRFASITQPSNAAVAASLRIDMDDRGGRMDLVLPYSTLEPVRDVLLQMFMGEKFGRDSIWETHLAENLWLTDVELTAVLDERTVPLREIFALKVGSRLMFEASPDSLIEMRCSGVPMYSARMGRSGERIAVQIDGRAPSGNTPTGRPT